MKDFIFKLAKRIFPEIDSLGEQSRLVAIGDIFNTLLIAPLALVGIFWLVFETDLSLLKNEWFDFLLIGIVVFLFNKISYFIIYELRRNRYGSAVGSLASMVQWSAVFIFGPTALWIQVILFFVNFLKELRTTLSKAGRWSLARGLCLEQAVTTLAYLVAIKSYKGFGGQIPFQGLSITTITPAMGSIVVHFLLFVLIWAGYIGYSIWLQYYLESKKAIQVVVKFLFLALGLPFLAHPFAIIAASFYSQNGRFVYIFFLIGMFIVAYLARQLSWAAETSRQRSRQLEKLEQLSQDIISSPPDASKLEEILDEHVLAMFPSARIIIWMSNERVLYKDPQDWSIEIDPIWEWLNTNLDAHAFLSRDPLPWTSQKIHDPVVTSPIFDMDRSQDQISPIGLIYIELRSLAQPWDMQALVGLFPSLQTLGDQVASALHQAEVYGDTLNSQQTAQELAFAGRIQASFLPNEVPRLTGWELAVTLLPARETSGDFFDFIPLPQGKVGILIADVADKGLGSALYMALSRTLIRTYALEYVDSQPDIVFFSTNERILQDARANLFVTGFYGILDPVKGEFTYCNAGHHPPLLIRYEEGGAIEKLSATGIPIGVEQDSVWSLETIQIEEGDVLMLYTDGITDAPNAAGEPFSEQRLKEVAHKSYKTSAQDIQTSVLEEVQDFVGEEQQFDDITLLVLMRDVEEKPNV